MVTIRHERPSDGGAREALLDLAFGAAPLRKDVRAPARRPSAGRRACPSSRPNGARRRHRAAVERGGRPGAAGAAARAARGRPATAAAAASAPRWCGTRLHEADRLGHGAVLLVGDAPYYGRFGFSAREDRGVVDAGPLRARTACWRASSSRRARRRPRPDRRRPASRRPSAASRQRHATAIVRRRLEIRRHFSWPRRV